MTIKLYDIEIPANSPLTFRQRSAVRQHLGAMGLDMLDKQGYVITHSGGKAIRISYKKDDMIAQIVGETGTKCET